MRNDYLHLILKQGVDERFVATYTDSTGAAINITGATFSAQARSIPEDVVAFSFTINILVAANGTYEIILPASTSSAVDITQNNTFKFDIEMSLSGTKYCMGWGDITMIREQTR
jgi:hypothetical protein